MKRINLYGLMLCIAASLINSGCTEETLPTGPPTSILPPTYTIPPVIEPPTPPTVYAGADFQVILPTDFCWLSGSYGDIGHIDTILWQIISGPSSYTLENPNSLRTKVTNLEKGIYDFELTVINKKGLTGKDISRVTVGEISANPKEIIFKDTAWTCPWDCQIEIENIYSHLPVGSVFRIYIQRDNSTNWEEVVSDYSGDYQYIYLLYNGHLYIIPNDYSTVEDTPHIKIVY